MVKRKLTEKDIKEIRELLQQGHDVPELAIKYDVSRSVIYRRAKDPYVARGIPLEIRNKVIKAVKEGYTTAEASQMYELNIGTVYNLTRGIAEGHHTQGNHIIRKNGIKLLNRLMTDGYLVSDFVVSTVRNLQRRFLLLNPLVTEIKHSFISLAEKRKRLRRFSGRSQTGSSTSVLLKRWRIFSESRYPRMAKRILLKDTDGRIRSIGSPDG